MGSSSEHPRLRPGPKPKPIVEHPTPIALADDKPGGFTEALAMQMSRHGDSCWHLWKSVVQHGEAFDRATLRSWLTGRTTPQSASSMAILQRIEVRYRLPAGYFKATLPHRGRATAGCDLSELSPTERRRAAWHCPDDFDARPTSEKVVILEWIRAHVLAGATEYRRFQSRSLVHPYSLQFPGISPQHGLRGHPREGRLVASKKLAKEVKKLVDFKTASLTSVGTHRSGVWCSETSAQRVEHLGLMLGALAAPRAGPNGGLGAKLDKLTLALLVFPAIWDWYLEWRAARRGFYTRWEVDMLRFGLAITQPETGWLLQHPELAKRLRALRPLVTKKDVKAAQLDWVGACENFHRFGIKRAKEVQRIARVHRDPFEPILPVLESDRPVAEYRKIADEILSRLPDAKRYPRDAAEAARSYLMIRLGLHLGVRQRNLRELLVCLRGNPIRTEAQLEALGRGELRWSDHDLAWEILIPCRAFKNAHSSFFSGRPFKLRLPDIGGLYSRLDEYLKVHRKTLLRGAPDPGTVFVKTVKANSRDPAYDKNTFYEAWRLTIERYGIYNPFTGRGAIAGLLPHGPHSVRDVIATHVLKETGSYEQASYAIQDTPDVVAKHYGRFLPQDKAALVAEVLNRAWVDA